MKKGIQAGIFLIFGFSLPGQAQFWDLTNATPLNGMINSEAEESMPVFSADSTTLYFVRTFDENNAGGKGDQDIWFSKKDASGTYGKCERLTGLNNKLNNVVYGMNQNGDAIYLLNSYDGKNDKARGIAVAEQKGSKWQSPKGIQIPSLDLSGDFVNFHVSKSEQVMLASFTGTDTKGLEDLYVIRREADKTWSKPVNLGDVINTTGFEISPYLSRNLDTLYFSSNGHGGYGDADIFYSVRQDETWLNWSAPVNLGKKINSEKFDAYLIFADGNFYWSSNRAGANSDLYYSRAIPPPPLTLSAQAILSFDPSKGHSIDLTPDGGGGKLKYLWSNGDTIQDPVQLKPGIYSVVVTDEYGQKATTEVKIEEPVLASHDDAPKKVMTEAEKADAELNKDLNNNIIFFDDNSSYFNAENRVVLAAIVPILKEKPQYKIFIQSYCDKNGTFEYNIWLSEKRMTRVIDYLVANGVERSRISGNFKGEAEPLVNCKNCNERQLRLNRRTTIKFIP